MIFVSFSMGLFAAVLLLYVCSDYKRNAGEFRRNAHLYKLVLSGVLVTFAWLEPQGITLAALVLPWFFMLMRKTKFGQTPDAQWFAERLVDLRSLRFYCLLIAISVASCVYSELDRYIFYYPSSYELDLASAQLAVLALPVAICISLVLRRLIVMKATGRLARFLQTAWQDMTFYTIVLVHIAFIVAVIAAPGSPGDWFIDWLVCSARDANLTWVPSLFSNPDAKLGSVLTYSTFNLPVFCKTGLILMLTVGFMPRIISSSAFLTAFAKRFRFQAGLRGWSETFLEVLRQPTKKLDLKEAVPWLHHASTTFYWLVSCYLVLFLMVSASPGPMGEAFTQWLDCSATDAGFVPKSIYKFPELRIFLASLVAMVGMVPLAVTGCAFLPTMRTKYISVSADGILFPRGPFLSLFGRPMRSWSDMKSIKLKCRAGETRLNKQTLIISFFSGGSLRLKLHQLASKDLQELLSAVDELADDCLIAPEVLELRGRLAEQSGPATLPEEGQLRSLPADNFRSTVFVPYEVGQTIPSASMRVIRQLSAKQLSAVYLVRLADGRLAIAKQFCFPSCTGDDTRMAAQVERMRKNFHREYELLSTLNNSQIARVLDVIEQDTSNVLVLEYARGRDLRDIVERDGIRLEASVIEIAKQLCDVMIYLHGQAPSVLHRDLTPDNLVIDDERRLKLIDFGAAHQFLEGITGTLIGKQCYVAPEQLRGEPTVRSDMYSFGCTLFFLLTGEDPVALSQCDPAEHVKVSRALRFLIMNCTEFDENERPESFLHIRRLLDEISDNKDFFKHGDDPGFRIKLPGEEIMSTVPLKTGDSA